jgi:exodeoxyribonuclease-5
MNHNVCDNCGLDIVFDDVQDNLCPACDGEFDASAPHTAEEIELTEEQKEAQAALLDAWARGEVGVIVGPAGCGKTTMLKSLIDSVTSNKGYVVQGCPTGKGASRQAELTGHPAFTIHKLLYGEVQEVDGKLRFGRPHAPCGPRDTLIIDEASMIGTKLYSELMQWVPSTARVLFVGDREQLEPVNDDWGVDLLNPTFALTEVHRQALGSPIMSYATAIRNGLGDDWSQEKYDPEDPRLQVWDGLDNAIQWYLEARGMERDVTLVTYTHRIRRALNERIRAELGNTGTISSGDRMVVKANNYAMGLMNGEVVTVTHVDDFDPTRAMVHIEESEYPLLVNMNLVEASTSDFWRWKKGLRRSQQDPRMTHLHYGSCLTVHSSQGSQWDDVGFVWDAAYNRMRSDRKDEGRRFLYTAVTRAAEHLSIFMV